MPNDFSGVIYLGVLQGAATECISRAPYVKIPLIFSTGELI